MQLTTLCYIEKDESWLMLHRTKKKNDLNQGKWIGIGGHFEPGESPEDCLLREVKEETGLTLTNWQFRGIVTFCQNNSICEYMCLFTADSFEGEQTDCCEGTLAWVPKTEVSSLSLWEGDRIFLALLLTDEPFFSLKLCYQEDTLTEAYLNHKKVL